MSDSIFEFGDKFGIKSPFGNWLKAEDLFVINYLKSEIVREKKGDLEEDFFIISFEYNTSIDRKAVIFTLNTNEVDKPLSLSKKPIDLIKGKQVLTIKYAASSYLERIKKKKDLSFFLTATYASDGTNAIVKSNSFNLVYLSLSVVSTILEQSLYKIEFSMSSGFYPIDINIQMIHSSKNTEIIIDQLKKTVSLTKENEKFTFSVKEAVIQGRLNVDKESKFFLIATPVLDKNYSQKSAELKLTNPNSLCPENRSITKDEFITIILNLRNAEEGAAYLGKSVLNHNNCPLASNEKNIDLLLSTLNEIMNKYGISSSYQKMHFFAQIYHESSRFTTTLEFASGQGYDPGKHKDAKAMENIIEGDGPRYRGRGFMQLTWRLNYVAYFKYIANNFQSYKDVKLNSDQTLKDRLLSDLKINNKNATEENLTTKTIIGLFEKRSNNYHEIVSNVLYFAIDSAGWFWAIYKKCYYEPGGITKATKEIKGKTINEIASLGNKFQITISYLVNGGANGLAERTIYYKSLNKLFKTTYSCEITLF